MDVPASCCWLLSIKKLFFFYILHYKLLIWACPIAHFVYPLFTFCLITRLYDYCFVTVLLLQFHKFPKYVSKSKFSLNALHTSTQTFAQPLRNQCSPKQLGKLLSGDVPWLQWVQMTESPMYQQLHNEQQVMRNSTSCRCIGWSVTSRLGWHDTPEYYTRA